MCLIVAITCSFSATDNLSIRRTSKCIKTEGRFVIRISERSSQQSGWCCKTSAKNNAFLLRSVSIDFFLANIVFWALGDFCLHNLTLPSSCLQRATINLISSDQHTWHHVIANSKQVARKWSGHWVMCLFWAATSYPHPRHSGEVRSRISRRKDLQSASFNDWIATNQPLYGSDFDSISLEKNESLLGCSEVISTKKTLVRENRPSTGCWLPVSMGFWVDLSILICWFVSFYFLTSLPSYSWFNGFVSLTLS